ncbi:uncharacterized protein LOC134311861 [Trichomycterus rosablanca]|uniref:uncharacterized protein LOC134311861 n=1 Tax=Trichomycterus rosablanca TaxID=2290929 RepID=UPI002F35C1A5
MYLIVEFVGEEQTGPVAKSWYKDGFSWWPPYKDENRLLKSVRKSEVPQPDKGWSKHSVRILYESESFDNIVANWKKSCYTSDLNSETELRNSSTETLGKRVRKKKIYSSSEQEEEEEPQPAKVKKLANAPRPPAPPQRQKHGSKNNALTSTFQPGRAEQEWCNNLSDSQAAAMKNPVLPAPTEAEAENCLKDYLRLAPGRRL